MVGRQRRATLGVIQNPRHALARLQAMRCTWALRPRGADDVLLALDHEAPLVDVDGWSVLRTSDVEKQHPAWPLAANDSGMEARDLENRAAGLPPANDLPNQPSRRHDSGIDGNGNA